VRVASLDREGPVERIEGDRARVRLGQASFTVPLSDLLPTPAEGRPGAGRRRGRELPRGVFLEARARDVGSSLTLVGDRVHEGIARLDKYLDDATLAGLSEVRIIHGAGTGRLRAAVRELLAGHSEVAAFRPGSEEEGGNTVTVASLADDD
jgi:DNA mismatch repair protein MutS2